MWFIKLIQLKSDEISRENYNPYHLFMIGLFILLTVAVVLFIRKLNDKKFRVFIFVWWVIIIFLEVLKEIYFSFEIVDDNVVFHYQWYIFPFQFCSMPFYILPFIIFLKDSKIRDAMLSFTQTFVFFAGTIVFFFFISGCLIDSYVINTQTMIHHASQYLIGIAIAIYYKEKMNLKYFLNGILIFVFLSVIAIILNEILFRVIPSYETCNLFYISYHYPSTLAVIGSLWNGSSGMIKYLIFLCVYFVGFIFCAFIFYLIQYYLIRRQRLFKKRLY